METKDAIRQRMRNRWRDLPDGWQDQRNARIDENVVRLQEFRTAAVIAAYLALPDEVSTAALIASAGKAGKTVCVPALDSDRNEYRFAKLGADTRLATGPFRVREPASPNWLDIASCDLVLAPGVAFDRTGRRLGHGYGFYDRLLKNAPGVRAGIAYSFQVVDELISEAHDIPMDMVITEHGVLRV